MLGKATTLKVGKWLWRHKGPFTCIVLGVSLALAGTVTIQQQLTKKR